MNNPPPPSQNDVLTALVSLFANGSAPAGFSAPASNTNASGHYNLQPQLQGQPQIVPQHISHPLQAPVGGQSPTSQNFNVFNPTILNSLSALDITKYSAPVGQSPNDEEVLVRQLALAKTNGVNYKEALDSLHSVCLPRFASLLATERITGFACIGR